MRSAGTPLNRVQAWLRATDCHGIVIPSTDEYLSEFAQPFTRRLEWVTGFSGSMGLAIVLQDRAALFVDDRYTERAKRETAGRDVEILDAREDTQHGWVARHLRSGERLAFDARLQSYMQLEHTFSVLTARGIEVVDPRPNPVDAIWAEERPPTPSTPILDYPINFAGQSAAGKIARLREWLKAAGTDCHLLTDPEDVAWLLNVRTDERAINTTHIDLHVVPVPLSRVLVETTGRVFWFVRKERLEPALRERLAGLVEVCDPAGFESHLEEGARGKAIGMNLRRTPHKFAALAAQVGRIEDQPVVAQWRWIKSTQEIESARRGHHQDGQAVIRFLAWLQKTVSERPVTEIEAAWKLIEFRSQQPGYLGIAFPPQSASGPNAAMPHYLPTAQSNRRLNDHPIFLMDSGGQYYGCSTDNAVCFTVGTPEARHIRAHTLIVKGYIALACATFPAGIHSTQLDSFARQYLWREGLDHHCGTGHGVGSFMNIHEGPHIRKEIDHPMVARMQAGMIVTNEPACYVQDDFGIRIECHLLTVLSKHEGFLEFEMLSRLPIDPALIEEPLLSASDKQWLADYHAAMCAAYQGCFDEPTTLWLTRIVDAYRAMAR